jgi:hypothetical protein
MRAQATGLLARSKQAAPHGALNRTLDVSPFSQTPTALSRP